MASEEVCMYFIQKAFQQEFPDKKLAAIERLPFRYQGGKLRTFDDPDCIEYFPINAGEVGLAETGSYKGKKTSFGYFFGFQNKDKPEEVCLVYRDQLPEGWRVEDRFKPSVNDKQPRCNTEYFQIEFCWTTYTVVHREDIFYVKAHFYD